MRLVLRARGAAAPRVAWERYADPGLWPTWSPQISAVDVDGAEPARPPRLRAGLAGTAAGLPVLGRPLLAVRFVVEDVDEAARRWVWTVEPRRAAVGLPRRLQRWARMRLVHAVTARPGARAGAGSATTLEMTGPAPVLLGYALPAWVALRLLVR